MTLIFPQRSEEPELMDDPNLEASVLSKVLKDLSTVNRLLSGNKITIKAIEEILEQNTQSHYTIVDMGCGDGKMLRDIADYFSNKNIDLQLIGVDLSEKGIEIAKMQSLAHNNIKFYCADILKFNAEELSCDLLLCTLTMHHFKDAQIPVFLKKFVNLVKIGVIINDLQRSKLAYYLFKLFSAIFIKTKIAKEDGLVSIKSGFTKKELSHFSKNLPEASHSIQWKWAFRYLWVMRKTKSY
ncbi:methyltransferase domain-containing protein [Galbibacter sp. BG1]|uniref:methyltransferase domain-containing protein n=1 Tax=Galbibacter sp. BG1 TaxID=1170699 RepID=UPI0015BBEFB5|nr:methyltransferase domain-containing protein [Galbibacter sp. BG1]QLE02608.1 methyltransferase domain-containing protein [Galbibacter sp. BG1]